MKRKRHHSLRFEPLCDRAMLHGGAHSFETFELDNGDLELILEEGGASFELAEGDATGDEFQSVNFDGTGANELNLHAAQVVAITDDTNTLRIRYANDDTLSLHGNWFVSEATLVDDEYLIVITKDDAIVNVSSPTPWTNPVSHIDVNLDYLVSPADALRVINALNSDGIQQLSSFETGSAAQLNFLDSNQDLIMSPADALQIINHLNSHGITDVHSNDDGGSSGHSHTSLIEVQNGDAAPGITLTVTADHVSGYNLHADLSNFTLAPENASSDHVFGEGHLHLYVDGQRVTRLYSPWHHLTGLSPGNHEVTVEVGSNNHATYAIDGVKIADTVTITVPDSNGMGHSHDPVDVTDLANIPEIQIEVTADAVSGWNLRANLTNFTITPENVSSDHVSGEGHLHVYINGERLGRMYGEYLHLGDLPAGNTEVRVELAGNHHAVYQVDGQSIDDTVTVVVPVTN